ncbi:MAG: phosphodiester glycosidase family protein [Thermoleophilia bacterium]|nr:phosphodiester glycosidase family protein [Thermoleophilia bacterium]MDH3724519.1 phosphodiester glycosidase family protein [Thermoleophilia bacterium]
MSVNRNLVATLLAAGVALVGAHAAHGAVALEPAPRGPEGLAPGISYQRQVRDEGVVHVVRMRPGPRRTLAPVLTAGRPSARASLTSAVRSRFATGAVGGINGDFFNFGASYPSGLLLLDGALISEPEPSRTALLLSPNGTLLAERLRLDGGWQAEGQESSRAIDGINRPAESGRETLLYTPIFGPTTPTAGSRFEVKVRLDSGAALAANAPQAGTVIARGSGGGTTIGPGQVVITAVGADGPALASELPNGARVTITPTLAGLPPDVLQGIGGGPLLVQGGVAAPDAGEGFSTAQLTSRTARSAVGQQSSGTLLFVMAEGPRTGQRGIDVAEQAQLMRTLGAVTAVAMDAGGSATLALGDQLAAAGSSERSITDALVLSYSGVHFPRLDTGRMTPNSDGVNDVIRTSVRVPTRGVLTVTLTRRRGRAIRITRRLTGPTTRRVILNARRLRMSDGLYTLSAKLKPASGGAASSHSRRLIVDRTLAALSTRRYVRRRGGKPRPKLDIRLRLFRAAHVSVTIRDAAGNRLRTLASGKRLRAGSHTVTWDRTIRRQAAEGTFLIDVEARSSLGRSGLRETVRLTDPRTEDPVP